MSYALQDAVWEIKGLKAADKIVLLRLAHHARDASDPAFPSQAALAEHTGLCVRAVRSALRELEKKGYIKAVGTSGKDNSKYAKRWLLVFENRHDMPEKRHDMPDSKRHDMPDPEHKRHDMPEKAAPYADEPIKEPVNKKKEEDAREKPVVLKATPWLPGQEVPEDWIRETNEIRRIVGLHPINARLEAANFVDWFTSKNGTSTDWHGCWKRWVRNSKQPEYKPEQPRMTAQQRLWRVNNTRRPFGACG